MDTKVSQGLTHVLIMVIDCLYVFLHTCSDVCVEVIKGAVFGSEFSFLLSRGS